MYNVPVWHAARKCLGCWSLSSIAPVLTGLFTSFSGACPVQQCAFSALNYLLSTTLQHPGALYRRPCLILEYGARSRTEVILAMMRDSCAILALLCAVTSLAGLVGALPRSLPTQDNVDSNSDISWNMEEKDHGEVAELVRRQERIWPKRQAQVVTVFSTTTITSVVTQTGGTAITSTIRTLVTETLTALDPALGRTTETLTITSQLRTPTTLAPRIISPTTGALPSVEDTELRLDELLLPEKRQARSTVTSTITIISRSVITVAPTVLVTETSRILETTSPVPSITTTLTVSTTLFLGIDGTPSTPPTATSSPTPAGTAPATAAPPFSAGAAAGIGVGLLVAVIILVVAILFCFHRKRKGKPLCSSACLKWPSTASNRSSTSTQAAAKRGTLEHTEYFGVGDSPAHPSFKSTEPRGRSRTPAMLYTPSPERPADRAPIVLPKRRGATASELKATQLLGEDVAAGPERTLRHPQTTSRRPLQEQFRHPSTVSSLLVGVSALDLDDSSSSSSIDERHDSLPESTEVQPPSPVPSSGIFGGSLSSRPSVETLRQRSLSADETDTLEEDLRGDSWSDRRTAGNWDGVWQYDERESEGPNVTVYGPMGISDSEPSPEPGNSAFL